MEMTLSQARELLRQNWETGLDCPCCKQRVQLYRHKVNSQITKCLIDMYHIDREWVHILHELKPTNRMYSLARFWGLIEAKGDEPHNNSMSSGFWRLTDKGKKFVLGECLIPKYAYIFNDKVYRLSEEMVSVESCLGSKFSYPELMGRLV